MMVRIIDSFTVNVTWDAPPKPNGNVTGYIVTYIVANTYGGTYDTIDRSYVLGGLKPGQTVSVAVAAHILQETPEIRGNFGNYSENVSVILPPLKGEPFSLD